MKKFYISLVKDLIGYYIEIEADSKDTVRKYLANDYFRNGVYTLPWCAIYNEEEMERNSSFPCNLIKAKCGPLKVENF